MVEQRAYIKQGLLALTTGIAAWPFHWCGEGQYWSIALTGGRSLQLSTSCIETRNDRGVKAGLLSGAWHLGDVNGICPNVHTLN